MSSWCNANNLGNFGSRKSTTCDMWLCHSEWTNTDSESKASDIAAQTGFSISGNPVLKLARYFQQNFLKLKFQCTGLPNSFQILPLKLHSGWNRLALRHRLPDLRCALQRTSIGKSNFWQTSTGIFAQIWNPDQAYNLERNLIGDDKISLLSEIVFWIFVSRTERSTTYLARNFNRMLSKIAS